MSLSEINDIMDSTENDYTNDNMNESIYLDGNEDISLLSLSKKVDKLQKDVETILTLLESSVKNNCDKMSEHIDFIEDVYNKVKYPMNYVVDTINNTRNMLPSM